MEKQVVPVVEPEKVVRGYRVKVNVSQPTTGEQSAKRQLVAQTVLTAMRRLRR
jgi:hypothetical protein